MTAAATIDAVTARIPDHIHSVAARLFLTELDTGTDLVAADGSHPIIGAVAERARTAATNLGWRADAVAAFVLDVVIVASDLTVDALTTALDAAN